MVPGPSAPKYPYPKPAAKCDLGPPRASSKPTEWTAKTAARPYRARLAPGAIASLSTSATIRLYCPGFFCINWANWATSAVVPAFPRISLLPWIPGPCTHCTLNPFMPNGLVTVLTSSLLFCTKTFSLNTCPFTWTSVVRSIQRCFCTPVTRYQPLVTLPEPADRTKIKKTPTGAISSIRTPTSFPHRSPANQHPAQPG